MNREIVPEQRNLQKLVKTCLDEAEKAISTTSTSNTKTASVAVLSVSAVIE